MKILFVCTANICRSMIAEQLTAHAVADRPGDFQVTSAGIDAIAGMRPDKLTVSLCREKGLDVSAHRARPLTKAMLLDADCVLCMEEDHKRRITGAYPVTKGKVFLLTEYRAPAASRFLSIEDPVGTSKKNYLRCYQEIDHEVDRIAAMWLAESAQM